MVLVIEKILTKTTIVDELLETHTYRDLSKICGCSISYLNDCVKGRRNLNHRAYNKLMIYLAKKNVQM